MFGYGFKARRAEDRKLTVSCNFLIGLLPDNLISVPGLVATRHVKTCWWPERTAMQHIAWRVPMVYYDLNKEAAPQSRYCGERKSCWELVGGLPPYHGNLRRCTGSERWVVFPRALHEHGLLVGF